MQQRDFIHKYNDQFRPKFNQWFFDRKDDDLINALRDVIYSCQRDSIFKIKVLDFEVIDGYDDVNHILWEYEESVINKNKSSSSSDSSKPKKTSSSSSSKKKDNQFAYINLKDSDLKLIKVTYYLEITEKKNGLVNDTITVYIAIPRIVDGFYFRLNGNLYSAMYQIVDASTYNNSAAKNTKKQSVTFKSIFAAIRVYRYSSKLVNINNEAIPAVYFIINVFKKSVLILKYFLAKFGIYEAARFLGLVDIFVLKDISTIDQSIFHIFPVKDMYICCPMKEYDDNQICQSFVYTLYMILNGMKDYRYPDVFGKRLYTESIGLEFTSKDMNIIYEKGLNIMDSLEAIYDLVTKNDLKLDDEDKADIYRVLRWIIYEFNSLRQKDNLDITTKKIRYAQYLASFYASKLFLAICRISDNAERADLNTMKKALQIPPMYFINAITKCQLVNYKNCVNDLDSIIALKYTYKGISGIGEKQNAISSAYRSVHPSHLGRVDIDSSSNSDPGVSGTICPLANIYEDHFSKYSEVSEWRSRINIILDKYRAMKSKKNMYTLINSVTEKNHDQTADIVRQDCIEAAWNILQNQLSCIAGYKDSSPVCIDILGDGSFIFSEESE